MRDIRNDLQERANLIEEQISAAYAHFEKIIEQLQNERDARVNELKSELSAIGRLLEAEHRRLANGTPPSPQPQAPQLSLTDFCVRSLSEIGPMSPEELRNLAMNEGYFSDRESADRGLHAALVNLLRAERIRQLQDGTFAASALPPPARLRRAV